MVIFYHDLCAEAQNRILWALYCDLGEDIEEAVQSGIPRDMAEREILDDWINRHNTGCTFEI